MLFQSYSVKLFFEKIFRVPNTLIKAAINEILDKFEQMWVQWGFFHQFGTAWGPFDWEISDKTEKLEKSYDYRLFKYLLKHNASFFRVLEIIYYYVLSFLKIFTTL